MEYVNTKEAMKILGLCKKTLQRYADDGKIDHIRSAGNQRRYNVKKFLQDHSHATKKKICYCRVSSYDQSDDLKTQVEYLKTKYPNHDIITDIGSGINFHRKGLKQILDLAIKNELAEIVVTYRDRLCRIGYELIEYILNEYSQAKIVIENEREKKIGEEITEDLIEIITVYSSKLYGSRSHKNKK